MIRIACHVQDYYFEIIKKYFAAKDYYLEKFNPASYDDIYFIEINSLNDLDKIHQINKYPETLIYIIGPKDFHLLNECLTLGVHLYFENDDLENNLHSKSKTIHQQIFTRFKTYHYKNKQMSFELSGTDKTGNQQSTSRCYQLCGGVRAVRFIYCLCSRLYQEDK